VPETAGPAAPSRADELRVLARDYLDDDDLPIYGTIATKVAVLAGRLGSEDTWNAFATTVKIVYDASGRNSPTWTDVKAFLSDLKKAVVRFLRRASRMPGVAHVENIEQMLESESPMFVCVGLLLRFKRGRIWFDDFLCKIRSDWKCDASDDVVEAYTVGDEAMRKIMMWMMARNIEILGHLTTRVVNDAVAYVADLDHRDVLVDHVKGSPMWDGVERLKDLMTLGFGIVYAPRDDEEEAERLEHEETEKYIVAVGRNFLIGAIARALRPGCKVDTMPIFMGPQGAFKSTAMGIIGGPFYREISEPPTSKDFYMQLQGVWIGEVAELASISGTKVETAKVKAMLSRQTDNFRPPYGRESRDYPRRVVFAGTSNPSGTGSLRDETGNRRYDPVACGTIDLEWLRTNRDQLIAEALKEYENGASWWEVPQDAHARAVAGYQQVSVHEETIRERLASTALYDGTRGGPEMDRPVVAAGSDTPERWGNVVQVDRVCMQWLGMSTDQAERSGAAIGAALVRLGWSRKRQTIRLQGVRNPVRVWCWVANDPEARQALREGGGPTTQDSIPF
jgi:hypothetical protein